MNGSEEKMANVVIDLTASDDDEMKNYEVPEVPDIRVKVEMVEDEVLTVRDSGEVINTSPVEVNHEESFRCPEDSPASPKSDHASSSNPSLKVDNFDFDNFDNGVSILNMILSNPEELDLGKKPSAIRHSCAFTLNKLKVPIEIEVRRQWRLYMWWYSTKMFQIRPG